MESGCQTQTMCRTALFTRGFKVITALWSCNIFIMGGGQTVNILILSDLVKENICS